MNKTNILQTESPLLLECVRRMKLGKFWNGLVLSGHFWRLYHHDLPGATVRVRGKSVPLLPDKLYLIPPAVEEIRTTCTGEPVQLYIHFELPVLSAGVDADIISLEITPMIRSLLDELCLTLESDPLALRPKTNLLATAYASAVVSMLPDTEKLEMKMDHRVANICELFRREIDHYWNISELAARAGMVPNAFLRLFRENTGLPPHQYLLHLRYARAAQLLVTTTLSIDEICEGIGVSDRFHFSRQFRKFHGIPPATYRKQRKK